MDAKPDNQTSGLINTIHSFPPLAAPDARILILGSMPGVKSLEAGQYYAHPQNEFWKIMARRFNLDPAAPYETRISALLAHKIALWDVLHSCTRQGSLDSAIQNEAPNALTDFLAAHSNIRKICFNGKKAETAFRRHILPLLGNPPELITLPSTSPAHRTITFQEKCLRWQKALSP